MATKKINWIKGNNPGVRYYKHETRKNGVRFDRYFSGSYQVRGKRKFMGFGWESEGWTDKKVSDKLDEYKHNMKTGSGPVTLKEEIDLHRQKKVQIAERKAKAEKENILYNNFWELHYKPIAETKKSWNAEKSFHKIWIQDAIGNKPLKQITIFDLEKLKSKMEKSGKSPKTVQHILANIRQVFNRAINLDVFQGPNPVSKIKFKKLNNKRTRHLTQSEAASLLALLNTKSSQVHDMALLSLHTGMRAAEIFKLKWRDVDLEEGTIHITDSKNAESRYAYMSNATKEMLERQEPGEKNQIIFPDTKGHPIKAISNSFSRSVDELGLNNDIADSRDKVVFHTLRHTFASWQVQAGMDLYTLQKLMGHKSFQMVQRYAHLAPDNLKKATSIFNRLDSEKEKVIPFPKQA